MRVKEPERDEELVALYLLPPPKRIITIVMATTVTPALCSLHTQIAVKKRTPHSKAHIDKLTAT
jgi:hypothetical protein